MGVQISGDNITVPGQVAITLAPTSASHSVRKGDITGFRAYVRNLDVNAAAPVDLATITIPSTAWIPKRVIALNPTADVNLATIALRDTAGGAGKDIVAAVALANMTNADADTRAQVLTVNAAYVDTIFSATTLYPRLTVAAGVAATIDLLIEFDDISDI